jgi:hypothetical protein
MRISLELVAALLIILGLTAFGLVATCLAERHPSTATVGGAGTERQAGFPSFDADQFLM